MVKEDQDKLFYFRSDDFSSYISCPLFFRLFTVFFEKRRREYNALLPVRELRYNMFVIAISIKLFILYYVNSFPFVKVINLKYKLINSGEITRSFYFFLCVLT